MLPRNAADYRTLLWLAMMPMLVAYQYTHPSLVIWLCAPACYLAACAGVIAHNHNHCPTFRSKRLNAVLAAYLSVFYGYPTFGWIPTHNLNHHKFVNGPGDATITWRYGNTNDLWTAVSYFFVSSYYQSEPIKAYIRKARTGNRALFRQIVTQYVVWGGTHVTMLAVAIAMHGWKRGLLVFWCALGIPAIYALWMIMTFNYMQHVHADPWSEYNHSRNFVSPLFNFLMFNNGFHTAHHENAGTHWSKLPAIHATFEHRIDPELRQQSYVWWMVKNWLLGTVIPSMRSQQVGRAGFDSPGGKVDITTADVDALEAGMNASIATR